MKKLLLTNTLFLSLLSAISLWDHWPRNHVYYIGAVWRDTISDKVISGNFWLETTAFFGELEAERLSQQTMNSTNFVITFVAPIQ